MEILWPKQTEPLFLDGMRELPPEEMERLQCEEDFASQEYSRLYREVLNAKWQVHVSLYQAHEMWDVNAVMQCRLSSFQCIPHITKCSRNVW